MAVIPSPQVPEPVWSASAGKYLCPVMGCLYRSKLYYNALNHVRMHFDCSHPPDFIEGKEPDVPEGRSPNNR